MRSSPDLWVTHREVHTFMILTVFAPDWLHPGDVGIVIEFDQLFQEQGIILKTEIDDA